MILVVNAGSSSLKYTLFNKGEVFKKGSVTRIGHDHDVMNHAQAWERLYQSISVHRSEIKAIGHRVVHGGNKYQDITKITPTVMQELKKVEKLAPLHMPVILDVIEVTKTVFGNTPEYAVFDTGFFTGMPVRASQYPLSEEVVKKYNLRRYGFHGISHKHAVRKAQEHLGMIKTQRMVSVHLGAGSSVAAVREGQCVDISMGFTPMEGLMMMTRSGDVDPGIILYLMREGMKVEEVDNLLNKESGLLGVSGLSDDMKDLLFVGGFKVEDENYIPPKEFAKDENSITRARLAIDMFVYRVVKYIGAYAAVLGGLDAVAFTGSIGAGSGELRKMIMANLNFIKDIEEFVVAPNEEEEIMLVVSKEIK